MFSIRIFKNKFIFDNYLLLRVGRKHDRQPQRTFKVAVLGAAGEVGRNISLLLKQNPLISELSLYDVTKITPGYACDLSHINTMTRVQAYVGANQICGCLRAAQVVVVAAGVPMRPELSPDELFTKNASLTCEIMSSIAKFCPTAMILIFTNPLNSILPLACEVMRRHGVLDGNRMFGVTTLNLIRAATFVSQINCEDPTIQYVPVFGGNDGQTIVPILSRSNPPLCIDDSVRHCLTCRIQYATEEVIQGKCCIGSPTLSMAFAGARFTNSVLRGLSGEPNIFECAYVMSSVTIAPFFSTPLKLGKSGIISNLGLGIVNDYERKLIRRAVAILKSDHEKALLYAEGEIME